LLSLRYSSPMACNSLDLTLPFNSSTRDSLLAAVVSKGQRAACANVQIL